MSKLRQLSPQSLSVPPAPEKPSTELPLGLRLASGRLRHTSPLASQSLPLRGKFRTRSPRPQRILDWDLEARAAGYGDPNWVPQNVTAIAWSWIGEEKVHWTTALEGKDWLEPFLGVYEQADVLTGHNLIRYDLPTLQADILRSGRPPLGPKLVQDTMRIVKTKGFKKGQDNISTLLRSPVQKMPLNWQEWDDAYKEPGWPTVIERVTTDVLGHKLIRAEMLERGWLKPAVMWRP